MTDKSSPTGMCNPITVTSIFFPLANRIYFMAFDILKKHITDRITEMGVAHTSELELATQFDIVSI